MTEDNTSTIEEVNADEVLETTESDGSPSIEDAGESDCLTDPVAELSAPAAPPAPKKHMEYVVVEANSARELEGRINQRHEDGFLLVSTHVTVSPRGSIVYTAVMRDINAS